MCRQIQLLVSLLVVSSTCTCATALLLHRTATSSTLSHSYSLATNAPSHPKVQHVREHKSRYSSVSVLFASSEDDAELEVNDDNDSSDEISTTSKSVTVTTSTSTSTPFVNQATIQFNNKLNKMSRNFDYKSAQYALNLLEEMMKRIDMGLELDIQPNVVTFTAVINAWARSTRKDAPRQAERVLNWMIQLSSQDSNEHNSNLLLLDTRPNLYAYNAAIQAWVRSPEKGASKNAERLLDQLWDSYVESGRKELKPDARTFNLVINAIARSREPKCADRAAALLARMEDLYTAGDEDMEPDALTFGAIINAYANSGESESSDKAAQILQQMESLHQVGYQKMRPNTFVYNACLNAFAKCVSGSHADEADQLLELMETMYYEKGDASVKPDVISYSTTINAHANSKADDAGTKAEKWLQRMTRLYLEGDDAVKPNAFSYTTTIKAHVAAAAATSLNKQHTLLLQRAAAQRGDAILELMSLQYLAGDASQKPTKISFDLVREALIQVEDMDGVQRVDTLRQRILGNS
jgi:hypothetical protein